MNKSISIKNLSVAYQGKEALKNITVSIHPKEITGIIGPNGAGKSTFIKGILQLLPKQTGEITYQGKKINNQRKKIAYVEQRQEIDFSFPIDVFGVVLLGTYPNLSFFRRPGKKERQLAWKSLEKVGMEGFAKRQIGELSGGQIQRVFIARALAQQAEWIFMDEPFVGIDATSEKIIIDLLKQLKNEDKSIVIVHHDLYKVKDYFDRLLILNRELIASGPVTEVFTESYMSQAYGKAIAEIFLAKGVMI